MKKTHEQKIIFEDEDGIHLRLVTEIAVYWRGSIFNCAEGLIHFYREAVAKVGGTIKYFETESMGGARKIKSDTLELLPVWLTSKKARRGIYMLKLESDERANEPSDKALFFLADEEEETKTGVIRLVLPEIYMNAGKTDVIPLVKNLVSKLPFESGHAGFSVNWDSDGDAEEDAAKEMAVIAKKYSGVDVNYFDSTIIAFQKSKRPSIKCANWLTLVGKSIADALPAIDVLKHELGEGCVVHELAHGLMFQAGPTPKLGYPERRELDPYHKVGGLLAEFRLQDHPQILPASVMGENPTEDWLSRFD